MSTIIPNPTAGTFDPQISSDTIWRGELTERSLTVDLDNMDVAIAELQNTAEVIAEEVEDKAPASHSHAQSDINGLIAALLAKANATHNHVLADITDVLAALATKADLVNGVVPESQLPSYVDDVIEGNLVSSTVFNNSVGAAITPESGKVYLDTSENKSYRWSGTQFIEIGSSIALGETSATAYRGDHGKIAYDHSQNGDVHVTATQKTAWDSKAEGSHGHEISDISGLMALLLTDTAGRQKTTIPGDVLTTIASFAAGVTTAYSAGGSSATATNAPNTIESWRYLIHKNYANYGWVMAFGSEGSFFINYIDGGVWRGWKPIWDNNPSPLWSGAYYMNANQTITPTKKLSECKNGWVLLWSDYSNGAATNGDVVATYIPKRSYAGGNWAGHSWLCDIPTEANASAENRCVKKLYMWDNRIVGNAINEAGHRNNVVLRAVYEF